MDYCRRLVKLPMPALAGIGSSPPARPRHEIAQAVVSEAPKATLSAISARARIRHPDPTPTMSPPCPILDRPNPTRTDQETSGRRLAAVGR